MSLGMGLPLFNIWNIAEIEKSHAITRKRQTFFFGQIMRWEEKDNILATGALMKKPVYNENDIATN